MFKRMGANDSPSPPPHSMKHVPEFIITFVLKVLAPFMYRCGPEAGQWWPTRPGLVRVMLAPPCP